MAAVKVFATTVPRSDISVQEYHDYWRHPHVSYGTQSLLSQHYIQSHRIDCDLLGADQARIEGCAEVWYETLDDAASLPGDEVYTRDLGPDEANFIDPAQLKFVMCTEEVLVSGPGVRASLSRADRLWRWDRRPITTKVLQLIEEERDGMSWRSDEDAALGDRIGALRHVRCLSTGGRDGAEPPYIGVRELWWPTVTAFRQGVARDPEAWRALIDRPKRALTVLAQAERYW